MAMRLVLGPGHKFREILMSKAIDIGYVIFVDERIGVNIAMGESRDSRAELEFWRRKLKWFS